MTLKLLCVKKVFPSLHLSSSFHLHPLISLTTFPHNLRTTDHLPKVPNPHSHQPPSCLCLNSLELLSLFFHCLSISQICKAINIASDQIFSRLPPFHHKSCWWYTFSWPTFSTNNPFSASLTTIFPLPFAFPCFFKDATASWLSLFSSALFGAHNFFLFFSQMVQCALLSPLSEAVNASPLILDSDLSFLHLILKSHSTETKQKAEKKASTSKALIRAPYILQQSLALVASKDGKQIPFR